MSVLSFVQIFSNNCCHGKFLRVGQKMTNRVETGARGESRIVIQLLFIVVK